MLFSIEKSMEKWQQLTLYLAAIFATIIIAYIASRTLIQIECLEQHGNIDCKPIEYSCGEVKE